MKKLVLLLMLFAFVVAGCAAGSVNLTPGDPLESELEEAEQTQARVGLVGVEESDGSPSVYVYKIKFGADTVTDNSDATATITPGLPTTKITSAPASPVAGRMYYADGSTWDPSGLNISKAYWCIYDGSTYIALWDEDGTLYLSTVQGAMNVITDADGIALTAGQMNSIITMTGAGDVDIPENMCDTATGQWLRVVAVGAHTTSITSNDAADQFVLADGTVLDAGDELDTAGSTYDSCTIVCEQTNKWVVTGENGTCADGGAAD